MSQSNRDIVMFNMSSLQEWQNGRVNRNFHVLKHLLARPSIERIVAVDYLPLTMKRGIRTFFESLMFGVKAKVLYQDMTSRLITLDRSRLGFHPNKLFVYSTIETTASESLAINHLRKRIGKIGIERPILWSYHPVFVKAFEQLPASVKVFEAVDDWSAHPWYSSISQRLQKNYQTIRQQADHIFTVSDGLRDVFGRTEKTLWVPNGVDYDRWQEVGPVPEDLKSIPSPIIGYIGVIQNRLDLELIAYLAERYPSKSFVFIGTVFPEVNRQLLARYSNVHFLGPKQYDDLPSYVNRFHVCIIPHVINSFTASMNPLKLYEYLACGLPVVTTRVAGTEMFADTVSVAADYEDFSRLIDEALDQDSEGKRLRRKAIVREHTWSKRVQEMWDQVEQSLAHK